jgi:hypothetical protein
LQERRNAATVGVLDQIAYQPIIHAHEISK